MIGSSGGLPRMFAFLFELAWASRVRLPLLIAAAFMLTNVHMRLEININFAMEEQIAVQENIGNDDDNEENEDNGEILDDQPNSIVEIELEEYEEEDEDTLSEEENDSDSLDEENEHLHSVIAKSNLSKSPEMQTEECIPATLRPSPSPKASSDDHFNRDNQKSDSQNAQRVCNNFEC